MVERKTNPSINTKLILKSHLENWRTAQRNRAIKVINVKQQSRKIQWKLRNAQLKARLVSPITRGPRVNQMHY